jgi:hypothetical protein
MSRLMHTRLKQRNPMIDAAEAPTSFRSAFAQARLEAQGNGELPSAPAEGPARAWRREQAAAPAPGRTFEVRIEKRRGRRADEARWGKLGRKGWELVAVSGKQAFFRRRHGLD